MLTLVEDSDYRLIGSCLLMLPYMYLKFQSFPLATIHPVPRATELAPRTLLLQ